MRTHIPPLVDRSAEILDPTVIRRLRRTRTTALVIGALLSMALVPVSLRPSGSTVHDDFSLGREFLWVLPVLLGGGLACFATGILWAKKKYPGLTPNADRNLFPELRASRPVERPTGPNRHVTH